MAFLPAKTNFRIWRGGTFRYRFQWMIETSGTLEPQNTSGFTGTFIVVATDSIEPWIVLTNSLDVHGSGLIFGGANGLVDIIISSHATKEITWESASYEFFVHDPVAEEDIPMFEGRFSAQGSAL